MQALHVDRAERIDQLEVPEALGGRAEPDARRFPLVMVEWHDAWFDLEQRSVDDRRPDYVVRTVGFLIDDGPAVVSLAQELLPDGEGFRAVTHIPRPVMRGVVRLGTGT